MLCGLALFESTIVEYEFNWLVRNFSFSGSFIIRNGTEISSPTRKNTNREGGEKEYDPFIWRKVFYREMEIRLGWKTNPLTGYPMYRLKIIGSIHKFARGGDNSDFFSANAAVIAVHELCSIFRIEPKRLKITNLEIGVNIPVDFDIMSFLKMYLIRYKNIPFNLNSKNATGYEAILTHYWVKLYAKRDVLRFEIHWEDMCELRDQYKLFYASDITPELINRMAEEKLLERLSNIAFLDGIDIITEPRKRKDGLTAKELTVLTRYTNNIYLSQLELEKETADKKRRFAIYQKDCRYRKLFSELNKKYGKGIIEDLTGKIRAIIAQSKAEFDRAEKCQTLGIGINLKKLTFPIIEVKNGYTEIALKYNKMDESTNTKPETTVGQQITPSPVKSIKTLGKEKRDKLDSQYKSFMVSLAITLEKLAA